jgi:RimJ/RimL family protein N-acetyltransferase
VVSAFDGDRLIGICGFFPFAGMGIEERKTNSTGMIIQVYIKPAYCGRKTGLSLIRAVVREVFRNEQIRRIGLGVRRANSSTIQVYRGAGFRAVFSASGGDDDTSQQGLRLILNRDG